jgi:hypothetical protein
VTRDRARKKAIRSRMAGTGEPYSVAARRLGGPEPADDEAAVRAVTACARNTLASLSARIEIRSDLEITWPGGRPRLNVIGKLARFAVRSVVKRVQPEVELETTMAELRDTAMHIVGEGFIEPASGRYLTDFGGHAEMGTDGKYFSGRSGRPLAGRKGEKLDSRGPVMVLRQLQDVTDTRYSGDETVRGTQCRVAAVSSGPAEFTVWMGEEYVHRIQSEERASGRSTVVRTVTIELWDFGVPVDSIDWSRLPSFRMPGNGA